MNNWKLFVGVVLVFIFGVLVGLLPGFYFTHRFPPPPPPPSMDHSHRDAMVLEKLTRDLKLTEEQKILVRAALAKMDERLDQHFLSMQGQIQTIFDQGFDEMEKGLNDEQKKRLNAIREGMKHHKGPPPPFP